MPATLRPSSGRSRTFATNSGESPGMSTWPQEVGSTTRFRPTDSSHSFECFGNGTTVDEAVKSTLGNIRETS
jgi:hypothetical protein